MKNIKIKKRNGDYIAKIKDYNVIVNKDWTIEQTYNVVNEMYQNYCKLMKILK